MEKSSKRGKMKHFPLITALLLLGIILFIVPFSSAFCWYWWCSPTISVSSPSDNVLKYSFHFFQFQKHYLNQTANPNQILDRIVATYDKNQLDYITGNEPLQFYVYYNAMLKSWNLDNPNYYVNNCTLNSRIWHIGENDTYYDTTLIFNYDVDYANAKEFYFLSDGDTIFIDMKCYFNSTAPSSSQMPTSMQITTPTWKCKACQYYNWAITEKTIMKAGDVSDKTTQVMTFIKQIIFLNFEMWVILFWILIILLFFISIGLIFAGVYWVFMYMKNKIK